MNLGFTLGLFSPQPAFITVLADKQVEVNGNVTLTCQVNTNNLKATWMKNDQRLDCVEGKHSIFVTDTRHSLTIKNADEGDEGEYSINLENRSGTASCSAKLIVAIKPWRTIPEKQDEMIKFLETYQICTSEVKELRILLNGPVGSGKSSTINTIKSIFEGRQVVNCLAASESTTSFSHHYKKYTIGNQHTGQLPFAFYDVMGFEKDQKEGMHTSDIINAIKGHIQIDYEFKSDPITPDSKSYISNPSPNDQTHCLVSVVPADKIGIISDEVIKKMKTIRIEASKFGIPQIVFMTRVDMACRHTKDDLTMVYKSRKIKEKMKTCSQLLGIPMNCIFPVKNYHEETEIDEKINCLMLHAFKQIANFANDCLKRNIKG
ncbi:interferon-induced protein 44-like [Brachyhypopomus gauderio]|uniref:interferon-induced protein 44-like n=1 Tax=Brachyhypopomus gauderio TaxID=698409 RepID=UPI004040FD74